MLRVRIALVVVLLACLGLTGRQIHKPNFADFEVYDTAAALVQQHQSIHIYDDADTGALFTLKFVGENTPFGHAAHRLGIEHARLYIYPPILADAILPLALLSAHVAGMVWLIINLGASFLTAYLMARLLAVPIRSLAFAAILVGLFSLFSTLSCLLWGQVTILLLLLWTCGIYWHRRGWYAASALALALATAIKLTPLLVVAPFLIWREWRWLRAYVFFLLLFFGLSAFVNGPATLMDYAVHVIPSMSGGGVPDFENKSLLASVQLLFVSLHGGSLHPVTMAISGTVISVGKAMALALLMLAVVLVLRLGSRMRDLDRGLTLALFALLSACVAPISWKHAYIVAFLPLCFFWAQALRERVSTLWLGVLALCSLELGSFVFDSAITKIAHGVLFGLLSFVAPAAGIVLVFCGLLRMRPSPVKANFS